MPQFCVQVSYQNGSGIISGTEIEKAVNDSDGYCGVVSGFHLDVSITTSSELLVIETRRETHVGSSMPSPHNHLWERHGNLGEDFFFYQHASV